MLIRLILLLASLLASELIVFAESPTYLVRLNAQGHLVGRITTTRSLSSDESPAFIRLLQHGSVIRRGVTHIDGRFLIHQPEVGEYVFLARNQRTYTAFELRILPPLVPRSTDKKLAQPIPRTWTDARGRTVQADLLHHDSTHASLRKADGKTVRINVNLLCAQDRHFLVSLRRTESLQRELRNWTDSSGTRTVAAQLLDHDREFASLRRADGKVVRVPVGLLSTHDQQFLVALLPDESEDEEPDPDNDDQNAEEESETEDETDGSESDSQQDVPDELNVEMSSTNQTVETPNTSSQSSSANSSPATSNVQPSQFSGGGFRGPGGGGGGPSGVGSGAGVPAAGLNAGSFLSLGLAAAGVVAADELSNDSSDNAPPPTPQFMNTVPLLPTVPAPIPTPTPVPTPNPTPTPVPRPTPNPDPTPGPPGPDPTPVPDPDPQPRDDLPDPFPDFPEFPEPIVDPVDDPLSAPEPATPTMPGG